MINAGWVLDFYLEVSILGSNQKDHGLWLVHGLQVE